MLEGVFSKGVNLTPPFHIHEKLIKHQDNFIEMLNSLLEIR